MDDDRSPTVVYYLCERGFHLVGPETASCLGSGIWSDPPPKCEKLSFCPELARLARGKAEVRRAASSHRGAYSNGTLVAFSCDDLLDLVGESSLECRDDGTWSAPVPACVKG
ncbi:unnamed protein product, partial [Ixodes pacificus]